MALGYAEASNRDQGKIAGSFPPAVPVPATTAFHTLQEAAGEMATVEARLHRLAERLLGSESVDPASPVPAVSGLFEVVGVTASEMSRRAQRMHEVLNAIERAIP